MVVLGSLKFHILFILANLSHITSYVLKNMLVYGFWDISQVVALAYFPLGFLIEGP